MKAQFVKTFIKAAAIFALATSIANCGAMPEESITETTYQPSSQPTAPADPEVPTVTDTNEGELVKDGCEA
ncbi:MAG: carbohydrate ABC transporter substrate-binding protein, partial [bacterium]